MPIFQSPELKEDIAQMVQERNVVSICKIVREKNKAPQSNKQCQSCGESICRDHSMRLCYHCLESRNITSSRPGSPPLPPPPV